MNKRYIILIASVIIILAAIGFSFYFQNYSQNSIVDTRESQPTEKIKVVPTPTQPLANTTPEIIEKIPSPAPPIKFNEINLAVPFSSQAPFGNWGLPYQEACEETSALLVDMFYKNEINTPEIVKQKILKIVAWEKLKFGYYENTTAEETAQLLKEYFGYQRVEVNYDISIEDIKAQVVAGRPVIIPLAGQMVHNPFYTPPGPVYHMLIIKGVTVDGKFITNDVGTKRGHNYIYDANILYSAIHDAPFGGNGLIKKELAENISAGRKAMIVVYPN